MQYAEAGADALAVLTDLEHTSSGYADLVAACRAVRIPVLQRDWMLHPMQASARHAAAACCAADWTASSTPFVHACRAVVIVHASLAGTVCCRSLPAHTFAGTAASLTGATRPCGS